MFTISNIFSMVCSGEKASSLSFAHLLTPVVDNPLEQLPINIIKKKKYGQGVNFQPRANILEGKVLWEVLTECSMRGEETSECLCGADMRPADSKEQIPQ